MGDRGWTARAVLVLLLTLMYAPLAYIVVASVNSNPASSSWGGFTIDWYREAWRDVEVRDAVWVSLRLAAVSSVAATAVATLAVLAVRRRAALGGLHRALVIGRVSTPEIIIATGLGALAPTLGVGFGLRPTALAHTAYLAAFAALIIGARAGSSDPDVEEAALDLGARPLRVLWTVVLPDLWPAIIAALLLTAAFSFDDVAISLALRGPQDTSLPVLLFSRMQRRFTPSIHAIGTVVLAIGVATFVAAVVVDRSILRGAAVRDRELGRRRDPG